MTKLTKEQKKFKNRLHLSKASALLHKVYYNEAMKELEQYKKIVFDLLENQYAIDGCDGLIANLKIESELVSNKLSKREIRMLTIIEDFRDEKENSELKGHQEFYEKHLAKTKELDKKNDTKESSSS